MWCLKGRQYFQINFIMQIIGYELALFAKVRKVRYCESREEEFESLKSLLY